MRLRYFGIRVTDLDRALRFYRDGLGLEVVHHKTMDTYDGAPSPFVLLRDPASGQQLELNWYPPDSPFATPFEPGEALDHIAVVVEDVDAARERLVAHGGGTTDVGLEDTGGMMAYVTDPDGNWLELIPEQ